jgi:hypothetical protein
VKCTTFEAPHYAAPVPPPSTQLLTTFFLPLRSSFSPQYPILNPNDLEPFKWPSNRMVERCMCIRNYPAIQTVSQLSKVISFFLKLKENIFWILWARNGSRDSSVGIALGYGLNDRGSRVRFPVGTGNSSLHWGPPSLLSNGYQQLFPWGLKRPGREGDHSPPSSAEVKEWVELYFHSPIRLHGVVLS